MEKIYKQFVSELKAQINQSRYNAVKHVNREQLLLYYQIGMKLSNKVAQENWGDSIVSQIAEDLQKQLPGIKGFSYRNLQNMKQLFEGYPNLIETESVTPIVQALPAQLNEISENQRLNSFLSIGFTHHMLILNKCRSSEERWFYIAETAKHFWSSRVLVHHLENGLFKQKGKLISNFSNSLNPGIRNHALDVFQDNYLFDFIQLSEEDSERVFEGKLVANIRDTIMALGKGFCFMGNQYRIEVGGDEFFIDLLFFNRELNCLVAFELKSGKFKPEYAGQLNFYMNVLDDLVRKDHENPSIGVILCKEKSNTVVEYAFRNIQKGMAAATYRTSKELPEDLKEFLPDAEELSKMLNE